MTSPRDHLAVVRNALTNHARTESLATRDGDTHCVECEFPWSHHRDGHAAACEVGKSLSALDVLADHTTRLEAVREAAEAVNEWHMRSGPMSHAEKYERLNALRAALAAVSEQAEQTDHLGGHRSAVPCSKGEEA